MTLDLSPGVSSQAQPANESVRLVAARAESEVECALLIDIREPDEHARDGAVGARLLPMSQVASRLAESPVDPDKTVFLICNSQNRSRAALKALCECGYGHVRLVVDGMPEWARRGWPLVAPGR